MRIYVQNDFNVNEIWNDVFNHIDNEMRQSLGSSYDASIINDCKNYINNNMNTDQKLSYIHSTLASLINTSVAVSDSSNSNTIVAYVIAHSFLSGIKIPLIGHVLDLINSTSDAGKKKKTIEDMTKQHHEDSFGKDCSFQDMIDIATNGHDWSGANPACLGGEPESSEEGYGGSGNTSGDTRPKGDRIPGMLDPLILDLNHNGQIDTTDINTSGGSYFDIDGTDGGIRERMGWV